MSNITPEELRMLADKINDLGPVAILHKISTVAVDRIAELESQLESASDEIRRLEFKLQECDCPGDD